MYSVEHNSLHWMQEWALFCVEKNESMLYQYLAAKHAFDGNKQFSSSSTEKRLLLLLVFCWRNAFFKVLKNRYIHVMNHVVSTAFTFSIRRKMASGQMIKVGSPAVMSMSKTWTRSSLFNVRWNRVQPTIRIQIKRICIILGLWKYRGEHVFFKL